MLNMSFEEALDGKHPAFFVVYCLGASISYTPFIYLRHTDDSITWRK